MKFLKRPEVQRKSAPGSLFGEVRRAQQLILGENAGKPKEREGAAVGRSCIRRSDSWRFRRYRRRCGHYGDRRTTGEGHCRNKGIPRVRLLAKGCANHRLLTTAKLATATRREPSEPVGVVRDRGQLAEPQSEPLLPW